MYEIMTRNKKVEKRLYDYINQRNDIRDKLKRLKMSPRKECDAHPLHILEWFIKLMTKKK
jgi:hypothetical protein